MRLVVVAPTDQSLALSDKAGACELFFFSLWLAACRLLLLFYAARFMPDFPLVRTAFGATWRREVPLRCRAPLRVCTDRLFAEAAARPSLLRAREVARERVRDGLRWLADRPARISRSALTRVAAEVRPLLGGESLIPARRACESPMAIACFADRALCFPRRMCSISSRTNSPAWVLGDLPSLASRRARATVSFFGIPLPPTTINVWTG